MGPRGDGKLSTLLTSPATFVNAELARLYGLPAVTGTAVSATLDPAQRSGLFTRAAFLARYGNTDESAPSRRGAAVLDRLRCFEIPPPPANVPDLKPPQPGVTTRERLEEHDANPCANACHRLIDPPGFAFENYDAIGAYRTTEAGKPIDAHGTIELAGSEKNFSNALELMKILANAPEVEECMARQWVRYAFRRRETTGEETAIKRMAEASRRSGGDLRAMFVSITQGSFTDRTPGTGESP